MNRLQITPPGSANRIELPPLPSKEFDVAQQREGTAKSLPPVLTAMHCPASCSHQKGLVLCPGCVLSQYYWLFRSSSDTSCSRVQQAVSCCQLQRGQGGPRPASPERSLYWESLSHPR